MQDILNKNDMKKLSKIRDLLKRSLMILFLGLLVESTVLYKKVTGR
jgi:hypothetical protein